LTLTAKLSPTAASGNIQFVDGTTIIGTARREHFGAPHRDHHAISPRPIVQALQRWGSVTRASGLRL